MFKRYRIVASTNTCYYSKNQMFYFLKSRILACRNFFFRNKTFLIVVRISLNFVRIHKIPNHESSQNFSLLGQLLFFRDVVLLATIGYVNKKLYLLCIYFSSIHAVFQTGDSLSNCQNFGFWILDFGFFILKKNPHHQTE